jgi:cytochrome c-type biogenesis protein CcmH
MIWLLFSALTALAIAAVMRPVVFASSSREAQKREADIYRLQLAELEREEERGVIGKAGAKSARAEISRRLLRASRQNGSIPEAGKKTGAFVALAPLAATASIGAFGLYFFIGEPSLADQQISVASEEQALRIELSNLEEQVRTKPGDAEVWSKLASAYFKNGDLEKAAGAFRKVIELKGDNEDAQLGLAETLIFGNNGDVTDAAKQALNSVIQKNPKSGRGRLWLAIAAEQEGRTEEAKKAYRDMLEEDLTGPLRRMVTERLAGISTLPGQIATMHGGSAENAPKGHQGDIPEMVDRLAERLKTGGGTLDNWLMLIRSYYVLNEDAKAQDAVARAKQKFASDSEAIQAIDALVKELTSPEAKDAQEAAARAAEENVGKEALTGAPVGYPSHVVGEMVARLAERLKTDQGSLEDWLKLIRSYSVLKEMDKAQDAVGAARKQFASDAKALERIDALLQEMKLAPSGDKAGMPKS